MFRFAKRYCSIPFSVNHVVVWVEVRSLAVRERVDGDEKELEKSKISPRSFFLLFGVVCDVRITSRPQLEEAAAPPRSGVLVHGRRRRLLHPPLLGRAHRSRSAITSIRRDVSLPAAGAKRSCRFSSHRYSGPTHRARQNHPFSGDLGNIPVS